MGIGESLTLHVTNLPDYCKRADNQNKRNQKLNYNQYFPYPVARLPCNSFPLIISDGRIETISHEG